MVILAVASPENKYFLLKTRSRRKWLNRLRQTEIWERFLWNTIEPLFTNVAPDLLLQALEQAKNNIGLSESGQKTKFF